MKPETVRLIEFRLQESREALEDARSLLQQDRLRSAMNRTYYSMFYATLAVVATKNLSSHKHSGVIALLHREFVRTMEFPRELARHLDRAFDLRMIGDYQEFVELKKDDLEQLVAGAELFISAAEELARGAISFEQPGSVPDVNR